MTDERKQQLLNLALDSEPFDVHNHVKIVAVDDGWAQVEVEIHPETLNRWGTPPAAFCLPCRTWPAAWPS